MMGLSRVLYSRYGDRIKLDSAMKCSAAARVLSYVCIAIPSAALGIVCTNAGIGNIGYAGSFFSVAALIICFFFLSATVPGENAEH